MSARQDTSADRWAALPDEEIRRLLLNARIFMSDNYKRSYWWSVASVLFGVGSTCAAALCDRARIDPNAKVKDPI